MKNELEYYFCLDFKKMMLPDFRRYRIAIMLLLFVSMMHLNGFSSPFGNPLESHGLQVSENMQIAEIFHADQSGISTGFLNCNSRNSLMVIEESGLVQFNFPTVSKKRFLKIIDGNLIPNTVFRDYNHFTLASSRYFAPGKELILEFCVFRL